MAGDGLVPPLNAPQGQQAAPGVQPGTTGVYVARYVIITGSGGGVFVYDGTPGPGNPPVTWESSGTTDPYGNALPGTAGVQGSGTFVAGNTVITADGLFTYFPTPGPGNLVGSTAGAGTTDPYGNTVDAGTVSYGSGGELTALVGGAVRFNAAGTTSLGEVPVISVLSAFSTVDSWRFDMPVQAIPALHPGTLAAQETWQPMTLGNGWAQGTGQPCQYRLVPSPANCLQLRGSLAGAAATAAQFSSVPASPAGYLPAHTTQFRANSTTLTRAGQVFGQLSTGGALSVNASVLTDNFTFDGLIPLDT